MAMLSYTELVDLVNNQVIDAPLSNVNGASVDLRIGSTILVEKEIPTTSPYIDLRDKNNSVGWDKIHMTEDKGYTLKPGELILAHSVEKFKLPYDIACEFRMRSSGARNGLNALLAMFCDPGWGYETDLDTRLTLELKNESRYHHLMIYPNLRVGQMMFYRVTPVPRDKSYAVLGRYNGTSTVQQSLSLSDYIKTKHDDPVVNLTHVCAEASSGYTLSEDKLMSM